MRDLFGVRPEINNRDVKLEFLMNQILELKNNITEISIQQQKDRELFLRKEETIEIEEEQFEEEPIAKNMEFESKENYILLNEPEKPIIKLEERYTNSLELEAIRSVVKNKKIIIKQKILAIASKQRTTAKQVKEIIVDKYKYCSKATFYRYLSELKRQHKIETISINDREYVCNISVDYRKNQF